MITLHCSWTCSRSLCEFTKNSVCHQHPGFNILSWGKWGPTSTVCQKGKCVTVGFSAAWGPILKSHQNQSSLLFRLHFAMAIKITALHFEIAAPWGIGKVIGNFTSLPVGRFCPAGLEYFCRNQSKSFIFARKERKSSTSLAFCRVSEMTVALVGSVAFVVIVVILLIGLICIRRSVHAGFHPSFSCPVLFPTRSENLFSEKESHWRIPLSFLFFSHLDYCTQQGEK